MVYAASVQVEVLRPHLSEGLANLSETVFLFLGLLPELLILDLESLSDLYLLQQFLAQLLFLTMEVYNLRDILMALVCVG